MLETVEISVQCETGFKELIKCKTFIKVQKYDRTGNEFVNNRKQQEYLCKKYSW